MQKLMWRAEVSPTPCWSPLIMLDACDSFPLHLTAPFLSLQAPSSPGGNVVSTSLAQRIWNYSFFKIQYMHRLVSGVLKEGTSPRPSPTSDSARPFTS